MATADAKQIQNFRKGVLMQEKALKVHVMRVTGADMLKMRQQKTIGTDVVADAVSAEGIDEALATSVQTVARDASQPPNDNANLSIDAVLGQMLEDKKKGVTPAASEAAFFLAWRIRDRRVSNRAPRLIGFASVYRCTQSDRFATDRDAFHSDHADAHAAVLKPFADGKGAGYPPPWKKVYLWLDMLCSPSKPVTKLLLNAVYASALGRKLRGIVCAPRWNAKQDDGAAKRLLFDAGFETALEPLRFAKRPKRGVLMVKRSLPFKQNGILEQGAELCQSPNSNAWRCPPH